MTYPYETACLQATAGHKEQPVALAPFGERVGVRGNAVKYFRAGRLSIRIARFSVVFDPCRLVRQVKMFES
jgi:hypothetical protein